MSRLIDIHCHILPGFDDGAADMAEALAMARLAVRSGTSGIVVTPHFRGEPQSLSRVNTLYDRYQRLAQAVRQAGLPLQLYPGAEILCMPQTVEMARQHSLPTIGDTDYLLTEFFFDEPFDHMDEMLTGIAQAGYIPIIAHPERYDAIARDPRGLARWFEKGYIIQINKGSPLGAFGYRAQNTADWILASGLAHVVASDAHSSTRRTTDMSLLQQRLLEKLPEAYVQVLLEHNPARLVRGLAMVPAE